MPQPKKLSAPLNMARGDDESMDLHRWLRHVLAEHHRGLEQRLVELREGQRYITHLLTSSHDPEVVRIGKAVSFQDIEAEITKEEEKDEKVLGPVESSVRLIGSHEEDEDEDEVDFRTTTMKARRSSSLKDTDFALREVWAKHLKFKDRSVGSQPSNTLETIGSAPVKLPMSESMERLPARKNSLIAYPAQKSRVCWDLFGGLLILYDLFVSPGQQFVTSPVLKEEGVRLLRILRLARTARLLRLLKLQKVMEKLSDYLDSEVASIMANICKMILLLLALNHMIACVCFHWSITQFTPASKPPIQPQNTVEPAFAIFVVVFALVGFSYVVGSILASLAQLRSMSEQSAKDGSQHLAWG
eukprot:g20939.t1